MNTLSSLIRPLASASDAASVARLPRFVTLSSSAAQALLVAGLPDPKRDYPTREQAANTAARARLAARSRLVIPSSAKRF
ncbi:hypothetical protein [Hymenobacter elongatus]|uniref:Uncharacterized protein n=1 Tax=Hymenobacter elongatus TaxID=877208 RepID=A0A4Z0PJQ2_9BACT|nr:hypothetical protein [Hymenobacter elongatus]TGE15199.1 hypothetical protein E5J99_13410 [Hymenobacter elongatus]